MGRSNSFDAHMCVLEPMAGIRVALWGQPGKAGKPQKSAQAASASRRQDSELQAQRLHDGDSHSLVLRAQEVMTRDLSEPLTIPTTAKLCGTSPTVLKQAFREVLGLSVHDWYRGCRMRRAAEMLSTTSYSVARISSEVGYCNPSKFSEVFASYMGDTPSVWRAGHRRA